MEMAFKVNDREEVRSCPSNSGEKKTEPKYLRLKTMLPPMSYVISQRVTGPGWPASFPDTGI